MISKEEQKYLGELLEGIVLRYFEAYNYELFPPKLRRVFMREAGRAFDSAIKRWGADPETRWMLGKEQ